MPVKHYTEYDSVSPIFYYIVTMFIITRILIFNVTTTRNRTLTNEYFKTFINRKIINDNNCITLYDNYSTD